MSSFTECFLCTSANLQDTNNQMSKSSISIYHEKQRKKLCALHSLNNLLQSSAFSQDDLDQICLRLSPESRFFNPHRALLGLGNYDINVIMAALETRGLEALWFDQRKDPKCLNMSHIFGFILNVDNLQGSKSLFSVLNPANLFGSRKHWIAFRKIGDSYYNLDSKLDFAERVGEEDDMIQLLRDKLSSGDCQVLLVVDKKVAEDLSCFRNTDNDQTKNQIVDNTKDTIVEVKVKNEVKPEVEEKLEIEVQTEVKDEMKNDPKDKVKEETKNIG